MEIKETFWELANAYRGISVADNLIPAVIRIVFVKYAADNYLYSETRDEMVLYANIHKSIASGDVDEFVNNAAPVFEMIDSKIEAKGILSGAVAALRNDLLGQFNKMKSYSVEASRKALGILSQLDLETSKIENSEIYNCLEEFIYDCILRLGKTGAGLYSSRSINQLAKSLMEIKETDTYQDFACGCGLTDISLTEGKDITQDLSDISEELVQLAIMLHIIRGFQMSNLSFSARNAFEYDSNGNKYSKIFADFPFGIKLNKHQFRFGDGTVLVIRRILDSLEEGGMALITCPSGLLFKTDKETTELRKELLSSGYLNSVITLPPVSIGTLINVNLLVLSKDRNESVLLVDASRNDTFQFSINSKKANAELTTAGIEEIKKIFDSRQEVKGISIKMSTKDLLKGNSISPQNYIEFEENEQFMSQSEISTKLDELYKKLIASLEYR